MAVFDRETGKIIVRVVYDGPGNAGKTTNLVEMCQYFSARRRSELVSPETRDGRTLWFDWLQIDAGLVAGVGLRCQIVTVPGQVVLQRRRTALLRAADVVVLVCDSSPAGLERVRPAYGRIRQFVTEHAGAQVPIVLQANKQDLPDALPPEEIAARLGADGSIPVIGARANASVGVKETLVLAIRAAASRVEQQVLERGLDALAGEPDDAASVLRELRKLGDHTGGRHGDLDDGALERLLAQPTFVEDPAPRAGAETAVVAAVPLIPPPPPILSGGVDEGWSTTLRCAMTEAIAARDGAALGCVLVTFTRAIAEALVRAIRAGQGLDLDPSNFAIDGDTVVCIDDEVSPSPPLLGAAQAILQGAEELAAFPDAIDRYASTLLHELSARLTRDDLGRLRLLEELRTTATRAPLAGALRDRLLAQLGAPPSASDDAWPVPQLDAEGLPSGFIWPVVAGRELMRRLPAQPAVRCDRQPFTYELGDYTLTTSKDRRFGEVDDGRVELLRLARDLVARGGAPADTVLVLAPDASGGHWIWTIAPTAPTACARP